MIIKQNIIFITFLKSWCSKSKDIHIHTTLNTNKLMSILMLATVFGCCLLFVLFSFIFVTAISKPQLLPLIITKRTWHWSHWIAFTQYHIKLWHDQLGTVQEKERNRLDVHWACDPKARSWQLKELKTGSTTHIKFQGRYGSILLKSLCHVQFLLHITDIWTPKTPP